MIDAVSVPMSMPCPLVSSVHLCKFLFCSVIRMSSGRTIVCHVGKDKPESAVSLFGHVSISSYAISRHLSVHDTRLHNSKRREQIRPRGLFVLLSPAAVEGSWRPSGLFRSRCLSFFSLPLPSFPSPEHHLAFSFCDARG